MSKTKNILSICSNDFKGLLVIILTVFSLSTKAQTVLEANGPGNTYELINSALAPGYTAVEAPDQCASHPSFGRHVAEVFDATLNKYVFEFYIHVPTTFPVVDNTADNDRCMSYDRQRIEIKTYESSPSSLKGTVGETVTYKWKFRLPAGFQPSPNFTHIHQIKAVGGDDGDPIFTLTPRYSASGNTMQLIHVDATSSNNTYLATASLSAFLGVWVEVTEQIKVGTNGTYSISINRVSDGASLLSYSSASILTIRSDNSFIRPKWGIYRSLNSSSYLRDDSIRFAGFSIFEGLAPSAPNNLVATAVSSSQINLSWADNSSNETAFVLERSLDGVNGWTTVFSSTANAIAYSNTGLTANTFYYYRIRAENPAGNSIYSAVVSAKTLQVVPVQLLSFKTLLVNKTANLFWEVTNEINFKQYDIELSNDGINFSFLSIINAKGTNAGIASYAFQHANLKEGKYYYRLKMLDKDGSYNYSPVRLVIVGKAVSVNVYPNPAKDFVTVDLNGTVNEQTVIILFDAVGREMKKVNVMSNSINIPLDKLAKGMYHLSVMEAGKTIKNYPLIITQ